MKKSYQILGRNELIITDEHQGENYKTLTFGIRAGYMAAPLSKPKVKALINDLQEWLKEDSK